MFVKNYLLKNVLQISEKHKELKRSLFSYFVKRTILLLRLIKDIELAKKNIDVNKICTELQAEVSVIWISQFVISKCNTVLRVPKC
jgi:hypothetical protein